MTEPLTVPPAPPRSAAAPAGHPPTAIDPPYENTFIGTFIYALGVIVGRWSVGDGTFPSLPSGVTLFQQTPLDTAAGDAIAQFGDRGVLLEFKREEADLADEYAKPGKKVFLNLLLDLLRDDAAERAYWRAAHFVAFGAKGPHGPLVFEPYACIKPEERRRCEAERRDVWNFIEQLLARRTADNGAVGVPMHELREYVKGLAGLHGKPGAEDDATGFLVHVTAAGVPQIVPYRGIGALHQTLQQSPASSRPGHQTSQAAPGVPTPPPKRRRTR